MKENLAEKKVEVVAEKSKEVAKQCPPVPTCAPSAPAATTLLNTKEVKKDVLDEESKFFIVPIDEEKSIKLKVSPTYEMDGVDSVVLNSFRKIIGYNTFDTILQGDLKERKEFSDYYNITVSMIIRRLPELQTGPPDYVTQSTGLAASLDKGFPYDDNDSMLDEVASTWYNAPVGGTVVGKLNGENVTKNALVNLVRDHDSPLTVSLLLQENDDVKLA